MRKNKTYPTVSKYFKIKGHNALILKITRLLGKTEADRFFSSKIKNFKEQKAIDIMIEQLLGLEQQKEIFSGLKEIFREKK